MLNSNGSAPMRDFDAFMRERISKYEPLERDDEPAEAPRMNREQISAYFAKEKAQFADRSPEQERQSFEAFFVRQNLHRERDTASNLADLKQQPGFSQRSSSDLEKLAAMRTALSESLDKKAAAPAVKSAMLEKFDKVYADPKALEKTEASVDKSLDFSKATPAKQTSYEQTL